MEATEGLRQAFEDLRETAERLAEAPATRALDWAPPEMRDHQKIREARLKQSKDISTHVVINNEMKKQLIGDKMPDGRIEQIKFLLKRLTWMEMEDVAKDIMEGAPMNEGAGTNMARVLINWAHKT